QLCLTSLLLQTPHSPLPFPYTTLFRSNTGYPIRIDVGYQNSQLTVSIYGTKTDDTYVEMTREVLSTTSYEVEYVETDQLPYGTRSEEHTSELQSRFELVCRLRLEKKKT